MRGYSMIEATKIEGVIGVTEANDEVDAKYVAQAVREIEEEEFEEVGFEVRSQTKLGISWLFRIDRI